MILLLTLLGCAEPCEDGLPTDADVVCTFAGTGDAAYDGGGLHRLESMFYYPQDIEFSEYGRPVISDWNNHKLRMLEDDGTLTTIMGSDFIGDGPADFSDLEPPGAPGTTVNLNHPTQQAWRPDGILLSASWHTHKMRTWDPETGLTVVVSGGAPGYAGEDGTDARDAQWNQPRGVIVDSQSNAYVVDMRNQRVRLIDAAGDIYLIAGNGEKGFCGDGGPAVDACLNFPQSENPEPGGALALDEDANLLYVLDTENHRVRVVDLETGIIDTVAGTGEPGYADGDALSAQFNFPRDIVLHEGRLIIADGDNHVIRAFDLDSGEVSTLAGTGADGAEGDGGPALEATFYRPFGVEVDLEGRVYVADTFNHRIRVFQP
ncbi:MAG: hypothetical protein H6741_26105 [Alphaproteobacteria bacterium]|nr:hypothetical protein [Alphaproteobacteria bacterium]